MIKKIILFLFAQLLCITSHIHAQNIYTIAGDATAVGYYGDGGPAVNAFLNGPIGIVFDAAGNIIFADAGNNTIRKIDVNGIITTVAGNSTAGYSGDGGPAVNAKFKYPGNLIFDTAGNLFISDQLNHVVRKIDVHGIITTIAGNGTAGYSGDGGPAVNAKLTSPIGLAFDKAGNLFVSDNANNTIRKITGSGIISTIAGNGTAGYTGDGGPAANAKFNGLFFITFDKAGNLFIADGNNYAIRKIAVNGIITTIAGNGPISTCVSNGAPAINVQLGRPVGLDFDAAGNLFIQEISASLIRKIDVNGIITKVAGICAVGGHSGDTGPAINAKLDAPYGLVFDKAGNLYDCDATCIRKIVFNTNCDVSVKIPQYSTLLPENTYHIQEGANFFLPISATLTPANDTVKLRYAINNFPANKPLITGADSLKGSVSQTFTWHSQCGQARSQPYNFSVKAYGLCPFMYNEAKVLIYVDAVKPSILSYTTLSQVCPNTTHTYTNSASGLSCAWTVTGGTPDVTTGNIIHVTWTQSGTGKIICKAINAYGCSGSDSIAVTVSPLPSASVISGNTSVCPSQQLYSLSGMAGSRYIWRLGATTHATFLRNDSTSSTMINWPQPNTYETDTLFVQEISPAGCLGIPLQVNITLNPTHSPNLIQGPTIVCVGPNTGTLPKETYAAHPGNPGSRYIWTVVGAQVITPSQDSTIAIRFNNTSNNNPVIINVYEVTKDSCTGTSRTINVVFDYHTPLLQNVSTLATDEHSIAVTLQKINNVNNSSAPYFLYKRPLHGGKPFVFAGLFYDNTYNDKPVKTDSFAYEYYYKMIDLCNDTLQSTFQNSILLTAKTDEANNSVTLNWTPYNNWPAGVEQYVIYRKLDNEYEFSPYAIVTPSSKGFVDTTVTYQNGIDGFIHYYRVKAIENAGAQSFISWSNITIVNFDHLIDIPSVITPNGDGLNDNWVIRNIENYRNTEIEIFNRWGTVVFKATGVYNNSWGGTYNGDQLPDGAYFYTIKLNQNNSKGKNSFSGTLSIIR